MIEHIWHKSACRHSECHGGLEVELGVETVDVLCLSTRQGSAVVITTFGRDLSAWIRHKRLLRKSQTTKDEGGLR